MWCEIVKDDWHQVLYVIFTHFTNFEFILEIAIVTEGRNKLASNVAVMHHLSSSSGLGVGVGFVKFDIARWSVGAICKFRHLLIIQCSHWLVFREDDVYSDMFKIEI